MGHRLLSCHLQDHTKFKPPLECYAEIADTSTLLETLLVMHERS